jgi:hypothetical protein
MKSCLLIAFLFIGTQAFSWGFFGHKKINETAVYTVPKPLFGFYKRYVNYITTHSTDPDSRRYVVKEEACRHYLDGDFYEHKLPLDTLPRLYKDACAKYGEDTVKEHGIVPWHIEIMMKRLTKAFSDKDVKKILKYSADIGHYIGDLHVPLHATSNYNGQKTNQKGIHALWESRLLELNFDAYSLFTGVSKYQEDPMDLVWKAYAESYGLVDSVLLAEARITKRFDEDSKYSWETRGNTLVKVYSKEFCKAYHTALGNMIEDRLKSSIHLLGTIWYTCWVDAGQPDLENMPVEEIPEEKTETEIQKGEMLGREEE